MSLYFEFGMIVCPACNGQGKVEGECTSSQDFVAKCTKCGGIFGEVSEARYDAVVPHGWQTDAPPERQRYFDFIIHSVRKPAYRIHGWYDVTTNKIVQLG